VIALSSWENNPSHCITVLSSSTSRITPARCCQNFKIKKGSGVRAPRLRVHTYIRTSSAVFWSDLEYELVVATYRYDTYICKYSGTKSPLQIQIQSYDMIDQR
jgi:hypothetical protein